MSESPTPRRFSDSSPSTSGRRSRDLPIWWPSTRASRPRTLADVRPAETVLITEIFFDVVRNRCSRLGIHEGETFECVTAGRQRIVLRHAERGRITVDRACARFVLTAKDEEEDSDAGESQARA